MKANVDALHGALDFSQADLQANRRGVLSQAQIDRVKSARARNAIAALALFFVLALATTVFFYMGQISSSAIMSSIGALLILINAILVGRAGQHYMRAGVDLRAATAEMLCGEVERVLRRGRVADNYVLRIGGAEFYVNGDTFACFEHRASYRVYLTSFSKRLLSAEPAG